MRASAEDSDITLAPTAAFVGAAAERVRELCSAHRSDCWAVNGHGYAVVHAPDTTWSQARDDAAPVINGGAPANRPTATTPGAVTTTRSSTTHTADGTGESVTATDTITVVPS